MADTENISGGWVYKFLADVGELADIRLDYIPIWISDFIADDNVQVMTTEQKGAYLLLLMRGWQQRPPASIPDDDSLLAKWAGLTSVRWSKCRDDILKPFEKGPDGRLYQKRLAKEWVKAAQNYLGRKKGAEAANAQRNAQRPVSDSSSERSASSQRTHPPNPTQPNQTRPHPTPQRGADAGEKGAGGGGEEGSEGQNGHGNMGDAARQVAVQGMLSQAKVNPEMVRKLMIRKDVTPHRITDILAEIRSDPAVSNEAAVLVHRLNQRGGR